MSQRLIRFTSAALAAAVCLSLTAAAPALAQIVVPGGLAASEGGNNNSYPFNITGFSLASQRYQQVYGATAFRPFGAPVSPLLITQIAFRPDAELGEAFSTTLPNVRIDLSTTSAAVDGLSTTFANNVGANNVTVFSGALSLSSSYTAAAGGNAREFDIVINLATPFLYDPAAGNLLLDVFNFAGGTTTTFDAQSTVGDAVSRVFNVGGGAGAASGGADSLGLVTRFTASAVAVPEAGTFALALPALVMVGAVAIRRRKSA